MCVEKWWRQNVEHMGWLRLFDNPHGFGIDICVHRTEKPVLDVLQHTIPLGTRWNDFCVWTVTFECMHANQSRNDQKYTAGCKKHAGKSDRRGHQKKMFFFS